ncbi:MAG: carboxypeptidase M32 [Candidatus Parcubacteria bacterium]|nr:MAG: carboxypeptidase M32 [Candidatus Parcubacteria bacterium]
MTKFKNKIILEILDKFKFISALDSLVALADWDLNTYMPPRAAEERGIILAKVNLLIKNLILDKNFKKLLAKAEGEDLNDYERAVVRVLNREIRIIEKLPDDFIEEWNKTVNEAQVVWRESKKENNFKQFQPYLEKIIDLVKKKIEFLGYQDHPYDVLIDLFEEGWKTKDLEVFFGSIKEPLKNLLLQVQKSSKYEINHPLENEIYQKELMEKLNYFALDLLGFNNQRSRLDVAPHPFENAISLNDVRITTWYHNKDFRKSLTATIHEFGHSLYELQIDPELQFTPLQGGLSYAFHESQSRFWENIVGKNKIFLEKIYLQGVKLLPFLSKYSFDEFEKYINLVRSELIRVESDEITYHFHIILRFELEKELLENKIKISDLPEVWRSKMKEYLNIEPMTDTDGVLQDIHWSMGAFGYFPTYSLGTFLSGLWLEKIEEELGKINDLLTSKEGIFAIANWLKEKIHQYGKVYLPKQLTFKIYGREFSINPYLNYLNKKFKEIYSS